MNTGKWYADAFNSSSDEPLDAQKKDLNTNPTIQMGLVQPLDECDYIPGGYGPFGECPSNPIPVNSPIGECVYLSRLRSKSGVGFMWHRISSVKSDVYPHPIDIYELVAIDASEWRTLYFGMYHPRRSVMAPFGLTLLPWSQMNDMEHVMCKIGFPGHNQKVENFPMGLPDVIARSDRLNQITPGLGKRMAQTVQKFLDTHPGQWQKSKQTPLVQQVDSGKDTTSSDQSSRSDSRTMHPNANWLTKMIRSHKKLSIALFVIGSVILFNLFPGCNKQISGTFSYGKEPERMSIRWNWRTTDARRNAGGVDSTMCVAKGRITNHSKSKNLHFSNVTLFLMDRDNAELTNEEYSDPDDIAPGESKEFTMKFFVPSGLIKDVSELREGATFHFSN